MNRFTMESVAWNSVGYEVFFNTTQHNNIK